jgi:flagellar biosynthesis/type III secretory pathway chaperone
MGNLTKILIQELAVLSRFLNLLDQLQKQIVSRKLEKSNETDLQLDMLSNQAQLLEKKRMKIVDEMSRKLDLTGSNASLCDLLPRLGCGSNKRLQLLRESILRAHRQAEQKRKKNKRLIDKSQKLITESMKIISNQPPTIFHKSGPSQRAMTVGSLIYRSMQEKHNV